MTRRTGSTSARTGKGTGFKALVIGSIVVACVTAGTVTVGTLSAGQADAAPNPLMNVEATHTVTIADDGSYRVHIDETMELVLEADFSFGGTVHDGFRLPDTEAVLPPYLRAQYSDPAITIDGEGVKAKVEHTFHAVDISAHDDFDEGKHAGTVDYRVTGAAVPAGNRGAAENQTDAADPDAENHADADGIVVYLRPLLPGDVSVKSAADIEAVECEDLPLTSDPCGKKSGEGWTIGVGELTGGAAVKITLDADAADLAEAQIDTGS